METFSRRPNVWRDPMETRKLYLLGPESFQIETLHKLNAKGKSVEKREVIVGDRSGNGWMKGRLQIGDILLCESISGDCFYNWYLVAYTNYDNRPGVRMKLVNETFGGYAVQATKLEGLTTKEYGRLLAGEDFEVDVRLPDGADLRSI